MAFTDETLDKKAAEGEGPLSEKRRSRLPIYVVGSIVLTSLIIGLAWWLYSRSFVSTDDAFLEGNITLVSPKVSAHVERIYVEENQFVKRGDLLIELNAAEAETKLAQARAAHQIALANFDKANATVALTEATGKAGLNQATSNLAGARGGVEQAQIASSLKRNAVEQAQNQTATATATLRQAEAQLPAVEAGIEQAIAQAAAAKSRLDVTRIESEREKRLFADGITSKQRLDQAGRELAEAQAGNISAEKQVEIARARLTVHRRQIEAETARVTETRANIRAAEDDYRQSINQIGVASSTAGESAGRLQDARTMGSRVAVDESTATSARAEIDRTQAAVEQAELEVGYTKIYAPQDGFVSRKAVQEGQLVQTDQALFTITQGSIWVVANFKETQLEKIKAGQTVDVFVDAYPGTTFKARVESFQAGTGSRFSVLPAENASGNFVKVVQRVPVKIVFNEPPDAQKYLLVPGMSVVPRVHVR